MQAAERAHRAGLPSLVLALWGVAMFCFLYGRYSTQYNVFPAPQLAHIEDSIGDITSQVMTSLGHPSQPYLSTRETRTVVVRDPAAVQPGYTLLAGVGGKGALFAKLIDAEGRTLNYWDLDWFRLWPNSPHLSKLDRPNSRPGALIYGAILEPNGDLVFNYDMLGMMKVDICGRVLWRLPERTHHTLFRDDAGDYWATQMDQPAGATQAHKTRVHYSILEVSPGGKVLRRVSIDDLLQRNGYRGLEYIRSGQDLPSGLHGDVLHVNSVKVFPQSMPEGEFKHGDVLVSLRNVNTILVFDPNTLVIKHLITGPWVGQHDPDFVDGSTISVLDNNDITNGKDPNKASSRILLYSLKTGKTTVVFAGTPQHPFYTQWMGTEQWLANGNLLIAETMGGRALEVTPKGRVVWEYFNQTGRKGMLGFLTGAERIATSYLPISRLMELRSKCH